MPLDNCRKKEIKTPFCHLRIMVISVVLSPCFHDFWIDENDNFDNFTCDYSYANFQCSKIITFKNNDLGDFFPILAGI